MQPADDIRQLFEKARLGIRPERDERVFEDMLQAQEEAKSTLGPPPRAAAPQEKWRIIMKSPLSKLAVAAAIIVAGVIASFMWTGTQSSVALADVLTQIQQVSVYSYQMRMTSTRLGTDGKPRQHETQVTVLISRDLGMKMSRQTVDLNDGESTLQEHYMLPQQRTVLEVMPDEKTFSRTELNDTRLEELRQQVSQDPSVKIREVLECDYTSLGRSTLDGIAVEVFHSTDPKLLNGTPGTVELTIWVDARTHLPVRTERKIDVDLPDGSIANVYSVTHDFQWNISIDPAEFDPVIPADYRDLMGETVVMPQVNEQKAVEGLRLFAELFARYPETLDDPEFFNDLSRRVAQLLFRENPPPAPAERPQREWGEQQNRRQMEILMPINVVGKFYELLVKEGKEPAYYGNVVTPQDADQVLMRWKVSDNEYRVIFGSLHVETVTTETLVELEKKLPR